MFFFFFLYFLYISVILLQCKNVILKWSVEADNSFMFSFNMTCPFMIMVLHNLTFCRFSLSLFWHPFPWTRQVDSSWHPLIFLLLYSPVSIKFQSFSYLIVGPRNISCLSRIVNSIFFIVSILLKTASLLAHAFTDI